MKKATHFIEVWSNDSYTHASDPLLIKYLDKCLKSTEKHTLKTIAIFFIYPKNKTND